MQSVRRQRNGIVKDSGECQSPVATEKRDGTLVSSFMLAGTFWEVYEVDHLTEMGNCEPAQALLRIRRDMPEQAKLSTFYHELVHAILFTMGKNSHDEDFVDTFGNFLHQFSATVEDHTDESEQREE